MMQHDNSLANDRSNYIKFIAYLQILGIILVVLGHSFHEYPDNEQGHTMLLYRMMYSFRMPLFMFTSGFLMAFTAYIRSRTKSPSFNDFALKKVKRLLIPFVTLSLVTFIPRSMMSGMADDQMEISAESFWKIFFFSHNMVIPYFWFIQSSFTLLLLNYALLRFAKSHSSRRTMQAILVAIFALLPFLSIEWTSFFSIGETVRLGVYFTLGVLYAISRNEVDKYIPWTSPLFLVAVAAVWALLFFAFEGSPAVIVCSAAGIMMCISVAKILEYRKWGFLDHLIGANYIIFLLSWYFNVLAQQVLAHYVSLPWWVHTVLSLVCGVYIPWLGYKYLRRHPQSRFVKVTAFLLGQNIR